MTEDSGEKLIYGIDDVPPKREVLVLGLQHYLTMFGSTVAIPLFLADKLGIADQPADVAWLICTMFFVSGITTLLQTTWGNRLPLVQGGTFSLLAPAVAVIQMSVLADAGWEVKLQHIQGAVIVGSVVEAFLGYSGLVGALLRFVGPITIAPTIVLIGLALFGAGAGTAGTHWGLAATTILLIIVFSQIFSLHSRLFRMFPILLGIIAAWLIAWACTGIGIFAADSPAAVSLDALESAPWFAMPYPFQWGAPQFTAAAVVGMLAGFLASIVESVGDYYACARLSGAPIPDKRVINRGIGMEGVGSLIAGVFGTGNGTTSYSENIGAIGLTRVGSRRVVQAGAVIMICLGMFGKFGGLFVTIPKPIVGGMYCVMFGMIAGVGLSSLQFVSLNSGRNLFVLGFAMFMGLAVPAWSGDPQNALAFGDSWQWLQNIIETLCKTGMAVGAVTAMVLDNVIPGTDKERGLVHHRPDE